ncbi:MAG: aspartate aminotransferase family protein [Acidobacteria bacterium]|nr:aspartate aminotransferase family protein [Acidobacteriota bacterium]
MKIGTSFQTEKSKQLYQRASRLLIEGGSSPSRGPANYGEYPMFIERGKGSRLYDVDGNEYIDWMMGFGALPLGHADPDVSRSIAEGAATGAHFATATAIEVEVAELLQKIVPNAEVVRFANTGTEAVMAVLRIARGFTGRPKILKFEGHYHGWYDDVLIASNPLPPEQVDLGNIPVRAVDSAGLNRHALDDTIVVPWNDLPALENTLQSNPGEVAAVITEGIMANMGVIPPAPRYLEGLQSLARQHGALFILDETVTGFRIAPGGCQEYYKLSPDMVTFGKALGSGLPVAAFAGRADVMRALSGGAVLHYGTHNASRIGMHAARANLTKLTANNGAAFRYIWNLADQLASGLTSLFARKSIPAIVQRVGPMFQIMFTDKPCIRDYREFCRYVDRKKYQRLSWKLFEHGVYTSPAATLHSIVTVAHTPEDVEKTLASMELSLAAID